MKSSVVLSLSFLLPLSGYALELDETPPTVFLKGEQGGKLDGALWSSDEVKGRKPCVLMYVDPDEKDKNEHVGQALKQAFQPGEICSIAVINLAASWLPDSLLQSALDEKQKQYPNTTYVKDTNKTLVKQWGLADNDYQVLAFDKHGKVIFSQSNKLSPADIGQLINRLQQSR
jgi:predicted transcriptional regulator